MILKEAHALKRSNKQKSELTIYFKKISNAQTQSDVRNPKP